MGAGSGGSVVRGETVAKNSPFRLRRNHPHVPLRAERTTRTFVENELGGSLLLRRGTAITLVALLVGLLVAVGLQLVLNR